MAPHDALSEFDLIKQYFVRQRPGRATLGIGDDCALITPSAGKQIAISSDMLVEDQHFFVGANTRMLGHKSLAVNLSDLAAMGARPVAFTLPWRCRKPSALGWPALPKACLRWPTRLIANSSAATPPRARSISASPCSANWRRARPCAAARPWRATTSGSAAR